MEFPIGGDNFGDVRRNNLEFVDKSLFIKDILDRRGVSVSVITRPRRFGKTLGLSMLQHFLAEEVGAQKTKNLFDDLKIAEVDNGSYMQKQGKFPVIFVSFRGVDCITFEKTQGELRAIIQELFRSHSYLLQSDKLLQNEKNIFSYFKDDDEYATRELRRSLRFLCEILHKHFGEKVWLLIDEYDTPIQAGYLNNYYVEIIDVMRGIFGAALKTNEFLNRAVVTGILRIAKESLFSGVNNLTVYSILDQRYGEYFGFTETEVSEVLKKANLTGKEEEVKHWYNGYIFAGVTVYNPWSIVNYVTNNGDPKAYWVNTSDNALIKTVLARFDADLKGQMSLLMHGENVKIKVDPSMVFGDLKNIEDAKIAGSIENDDSGKAAWSLLLMSGYLKVLSAREGDDGFICQCAVPNEEIRRMYRGIIKTWFGTSSSSNFQVFLRYLLAGNVEEFSSRLDSILLQTLSTFDAAYNPEAFYHGFMLGILVSIDHEEYELKSNRESGDGRYDVSILPKDTAKPAIILEFKASDPSKTVINANDNGESLEIFLEQDARDAYVQIVRNKYEAECNQRGYKNIVKIGMAFYGKKLKVCSELPLKKKTAR